MKKEIITNNHFKARDIYSLWSKYCKSAKKSIDVISPYVDNTVKNLLSSKHIDAQVSKKIFTRIDSDTIFEKPYQIRALINSIKHGISIYQIEELHSKALIIDNECISVGSQNFTKKGRKNKETSMMSNWIFNSTKYLETLNKWMEEAEEIEIELLLMLESKLKKLRPKIKLLRQEHSNIFEELVSKDSERKRQVLLSNILILKSQSNTSFASEFIYLTKTYIDNWENPITTYLVDSGRDLRRWKVKGKEDSAHLVRLNYYPCINIEDNSIAYVRLTKTRISFYLTRIGLGHYKINDAWYMLSINCPEEKTTEVNYQIKLNNWKSGENILNYYFDGAKFNFILGEFQDESEQKYLTKHLINKTEKSQELISHCFKGHNMETLGRSITKYFDGWWYKLYIVEYLDNPIIIAEKRN